MAGHIASVIFSEASLSHLSSFPLDGVSNVVVVDFRLGIDVNICLSDYCTMNKLYSSCYELCFLKLTFKRWALAYDLFYRANHVIMDRE